MRTFFFFYFTLPLYKNTHVILSILNYILKYYLFIRFLLLSQIIFIFIFMYMSKELFKILIYSNHVYFFW